MPADLQRFAGLPMRVRYAPEGPLEAGQQAGEVTEVLDLVSYDAAAGLTVWKLADVRANKTHLKKGQPLGKKARERRLALPCAALKKIHLIVDV